jgi:hypothetical protein
MWVFPEQFETANSLQPYTLFSMTHLVHVDGVGRCF